MVLPPKLLKAVKPNRRHKLKGPDGKFINKANYAKLTRGTSKTQRKENWLRNKWGAPPSGWTWIRLVEHYPGRFDDSISELGTG